MLLNKKSISKLVLYTILCILSCIFALWLQRYKGASEPVATMPFSRFLEMSLWLAIYVINGIFALGMFLKAGLILKEWE